MVISPQNTGSKVPGNQGTLIVSPSSANLAEGNEIMVTNRKRAGGKRGQQMGFAGQPDRNRVEMKETPALRGNRKAANKMFGDVSDQQTGSNVVAPSTNSPSTAGMKEPQPNQSSAEAVFKRRLAKKRGK